MLKVTTEMRALVCRLVSLAVWMNGWIVMSYSDEHPVLGFIHHKAPHIFYAVKGAYVGMWFTIPYLVASMLLSLLYIFAVSHEQPKPRGCLERYIEPAKHQTLWLPVGELHHPRKSVPSNDPRWLVIPERHLYTGLPSSACLWNQAGRARVPNAFHLRSHGAP